ncbi:unnamed protein product [Closterium sp. NIES-53]
MATNYHGSPLNVVSSDCNERNGGAPSTRRGAVEAAERPVAFLGGAQHYCQQVFRAKGLTREEYISWAAARLRHGNHAAATGATDEGDTSAIATATDSDYGSGTVVGRSAANGAANSAGSAAAASAPASRLLLQQRRHSLEACFRTVKFQPRMSLLSATTRAAASADADGGPAIAAAHEDRNEETGAAIAASGAESASGSDKTEVIVTSTATGSHGCFLDKLPDDVLIDILSALGSARHVAAAGAVCRRWRRLVPFVPSLAFTRLSLPAAKFEEVVSRMVMRSHGLSSLHMETVNCGGSHGVGGDNNSAHPREFIVEAWARHAGSSLRHVTFTQHKAVTAAGSSAASSAGGSAVPSCTVYAGGPDLSSHLQHLASHCPNLSSMRLGSFTLPPHFLRGNFAFPHLRALSLEWTNLAGSTLQSLLDACPNLRRLSIFMAAGLTAHAASYPAGHYAALQAAAGVRGAAATAGGHSAGLCLRLPARLESIELAYLRVSAVTLICSETECTGDKSMRRACGGGVAGGLREVSIRDMFLTMLSLPNARALASLSVATASALRLSAPSSAALASLEVRAGTVHWPSLESLVAGASAALKHLALDLFTVECGGGSGEPRNGAATDIPRDAARGGLDGTRGVTSATIGAGSGGLDLLNLNWLTSYCPNLSSLSLGPLPWECLIRGGCLAAPECAPSSVSDAGGSAEARVTLGRVMNPVDVDAWPSQLENLSVKLRGRSGATLLWIGAFMRQCAGSLKSVKVVCLEDEEEEEEEEQEEEEDEDNEEWSEYGSENEDEGELQEEIESENEGYEEEWDGEKSQGDSEEYEEEEGKEWGDMECGRERYTSSRTTVYQSNEEWDSEGEDEEDEGDENSNNHSDQHHSHCQMPRQQGSHLPELQRALCSVRGCGGGGGSGVGSSSGSSSSHASTTRDNSNSNHTSSGVNSSNTMTTCTVSTSRYRNSPVANNTVSDAKQRLIAARAFFSSAMDALQRAFPHVDMITPCLYV